MSRVEGLGAPVRAAVAVCVLATACGACTATARKASPADESETVSPQAAEGDDKGGSGTRAKGEEGTMGRPLPGAAAPRSGLGGGAAPVASAAAPGLFPAPTATTSPPKPDAEMERAAPLAAPAAHLDPNARYATTYRPGGAALAAFDAAVSRGQIPATYKDLVGDFGARYAPALERPSTGALALSVQTERAAIGPNGGATNLRVALASSDAMPSRAPLSVHIVLDTSGSMSGPAIDDARKAAEAVVEKLAPTDDFSMVTFSDTAHLLVTDGPVGPRRAQALERIHGVHADGGTNISSGLDLAYAQAHSTGIPADAVRIVMLLSDGHANGGDTDPQRLAQRAASAFQEGVQTSAFGLGGDFDAALMSRIADRGAGGYYYLADSSQIAPALAREIDARLQPVATAVELRVRLRPDVSATKVFGSRELSSAEAVAVRAQEVAIDQKEKRRGIAGDRDIDAAGGMRFFIPAFARADRHATMITLALPAGAGTRSVASVELRYKDRLLAKNVTTEVPVKMQWAASDADSAATEDAGVERMALAFEAGEAILEAAERVDRGDRAGARSVLEERATVLATASKTLGEPMLAEDGARLVRLAGAVGGSEQLHDPLPLVVMLRGTGYGYL